ncbi:hypothetical protein GEMRC1_002979 [Eukaryota sp. GEM-RC1]
MKLLLLVTVFVYTVLASCEKNKHHIDEPLIGDEFCQMFDSESYCKTWLDIPVCQGLDIPCDGSPICPRYPWSDRRFDVLEGHGLWFGYKKTVHGKRVINTRRKELKLN